jgi:hypothetical protein
MDTSGPMHTPLYAKAPPHLRQPGRRGSQRTAFLGDETLCLRAAGVSASALGVQAQPTWLHLEGGAFAFVHHWRVSSPRNAAGGWWERGVQCEMRGRCELERGGAGGCLGRLRLPPTHLSGRVLSLVERQLLSKVLLVTRGPRQGEGCLGGVIRDRKQRQLRVPSPDRPCVVEAANRVYQYLLVSGTAWCIWCPSEVAGRRTEPGLACGCRRGTHAMGWHSVMAYTAITEAPNWLFSAWVSSAGMLAPMASINPPCICVGERRRCVSESPGRESSGGSQRPRRESVTISRRCACESMVG